jgi:hypothetical protein
MLKIIRPKEANQITAGTGSKRNKEGKSEQLKV